MIKNHIIIAWRSLFKRKKFAFLNILGLSLGLWCTLSISLWVLDEFEKDTFHKNGNRISQVLTNSSSEDGHIQTWDGTGYPVAEALAYEIPEIDRVVRRAGPRESILKTQDKSISIQVIAVDSSFFSMFSFPLREGQRDRCLVDLKNVVLSEELADNYFPNGEAMGKTVNLMLDERVETFLVSGVFRAIPKQSTLRFDAVVPLDNFLPMNNKSWGNTWLKTYILTTEGTDRDALAGKIRHIPQEKGNDNLRTLSLQPLNERYLYGKFENGRAVGGRIDQIIFFILTALFTLLIACFNFINLTTAMAVTRSKEVGIKKVLGAARGSLIRQFFAESAILVILSVGVAVALTALTIPMLNTITGKELYMDFRDPRIYLLLAGISILTILLSGLYPACTLSSFRSMDAIHKKLKNTRSELLLRKGLVVFQFFLCMLMITGTLVVFLQLKYVRNKNLGLDKEQILYVTMDNETYLQSRAIKKELADFSGIARVSSASSNFMDAGGSTSDPVWEGGNMQDGTIWFSILTVDFGLLEMLNVGVKEGRSFSTEFSADTLNYLVNEAAVRAMGLENPIGKPLSFWGDTGGKIVGVTKDFHFASLHNPIAPMIIRCRPSETHLFFIKTIAGRSAEAISHIERVHRKFSDIPPEYHFLDQVLEEGYGNEKKLQQLAGIFAALAVFISCIGLFGLAMFTANQRTREIAIRKVLGANIPGLYQLLSGDFIKLVGIALLLATPMAWHLINRWLQTFAFHVALKWWMFMAAAGILILLALITVSYQTIQVAFTNPANSLRSE